MASSNKFCRTVSQSTGGHYVTWDDLNNVKSGAVGSYAVSHQLIQGKGESKNRPSSITCTNYGFSLPQGAEPVKVVVNYRHQKLVGSDYSSKYPKRVVNVPAPTVSLVGVSGFSGKGVAPTLDMVTRSKTFNVKGKLTRSQINSSSFGAKIDYPTNSNAYNGYMRVNYVTITVYYNLSSYGLSVKKVSGGYNKEDYTVQISISNKNRTGFKPTVALSSPVGFSFKSAKGTGVVTQNSARSFTWDPKLSAKVGTASVNVVFVPDVTYPSGSSSYSGVFSVSESLNSVGASHTAVIRERPPSEQEETEPDSTNMNVESKDAFRVYQCKAYELFDYVFEFTDEEVEAIISTTQGVFGAARVTVDNLMIRVRSGSWITPTQPSDCSSIYIDRDQRTIDAKLLSQEVGEGSITIWYDAFDSNLQRIYVELCTFYFDIRPEEEDLTVPYYSLIEPSQEEYDRLGDGYTYIAETMLKHSTTDDFERDWYKNNRIGVFNNAISDNITITEVVDPETGDVTEVVTDSTDYDNLTSQEIIENAEYWADAPTTVNDYNNLECEFTYNENYPLYIIFTGDYPETSTYDYDSGTITYTEPCIIEKPTYTERETNGNYPEPINNLIINDGSTAEQNIPENNQSTPIILYNYPLDEDYGTNETTSIRGLQINGNIEQTDDLVLTCKLISPTGASGERTIVLNSQDSTIDSDTEFQFGGLGDLWGFTTEDLINLEDWEIQITAQNILLEGEANINYGDIQLTIYTEKLEQQLINIKIDGEDLSYYGAFIQDAKIPEGLDTDTSFLNIDGTDTNDAYRQNIREKTIELELTLDGCDLQTNTDLLRQLTRLLVNEKDQYNRPIPNTIEFSHYPDVYFEYIMQDTLEVTNDAGAYTVKAKLVIPAGTAYSKQTTTTNITGFVQGIAAINPVISFKPQAETIIIKELETGQEFHMGYSGDWQNGIVEIDCEDRKALLKTTEEDLNPVDISSYVDFNSDWFCLHGEYSFSASGCVIRTVEYSERW